MVSFSLARVPVGQERARLQRDAGVAAEVERLLDHRRGVAEGGVDVADVERALEGEVVAELGVDDRGAGLERRLHVDRHRQRLESASISASASSASARLAATTAQNGSPAQRTRSDRQRVLRRRAQALEVAEHADPGRADAGEFLAGHHGDHAGRGRWRRRCRCATMRAWACGLRRNATCASRGRRRSST